MTGQSTRSGSSSRSSVPKLRDPKPDARKAAIIAAIRTTGLMPYLAARSIGVASSTFYWWMDNDAVFAEQVATAEAVFERRMASIMVRSASQGSWQSALAQLERRFPSRWSPRHVVDVTVNGDDALDDLDAKYPTPEALDAAIAELHRQALDGMSDEDLDALIAERKGRAS